MQKKPADQTSKPITAESIAHPAMTERRKFPRALPMPEVKEGYGGDSEWAMWLEHDGKQPPIDFNLDSPD